MPLLRISTAVCLFVAVAWGAAALWFDGSGPIAIAYLALCVVLTIAVRPFLRSQLAVAVVFLVVAGWWFSIEPSNDRDWAPEVERTTRVRVDGDLATIENVRNFHYRGLEDYDARWEERTIDLSRVTGVDFLLSYWDSPWIAHTILSFSFEDAAPLAISIETRKEASESYSAVLGFFRQFELYYVVADERDVVGVRTHHREEDVYLYRLKASPEFARELLVDYLETIEALATEPRWYNAATHNCTTTIRRHLEHIAAGNPFDWRVLVNGRIDELGYERGNVDTSLPFEELRRRSAISEKARENPIDDAFSARIRSGLPGFSGGSVAGPR